MDESKVQFATHFNYQKIALASSRTDSITAATYPLPVTVTITHGLGAITSARCWYDPELGRRFPISPDQYVDDGGGASFVNLVTVDAYLTTTTLVFLYYNASGSSKDVVSYYRVYYDT